ncbi:MAG: 50S ribosomal protein L29 [Sulfolobales archaeon]|nr:50S ribosomal protein L29 [Sulfolobales archaeon]MCX8186385.1 50S ribosomal protein L29 [Sulfolobales archaeon]MDW7968880.1 50S ribosomal protein L29 [Sulfolobales archaeon]
MSLSADEIRKMPREDRLKQLNELELELMKLRAQAAMGTLTNVGRIKVVRKNIARILTVQREEEIKSGEKR